MAISIQKLGQHDGETVTVRGWLTNKRSSGKICFLQLRDGSGDAQVVASQSELSEEAWQSVLDVTLESTVRVTGIARVDERAPGGVEIQATDFSVKNMTVDYPITNKEHGVAFLMEHRHLWLRSSKQRAALAVRSEVCQAIRDFYYERGFTLIDSPILTPTSSEGTSTLFATDYFGEQAYLTQSGQLYLEPACAAFGKVYCMGPTFRAEKSKTRRHLTEFWMVEPEIAFLEFKGLILLAEEFVCYLTARVLERCSVHLETLERDLTKLERIKSGFPVITYSEAIDLLREKGSGISWGEDFGAEDETLIASEHDCPVFVTHFPTAIKAFYMEPDPQNQELALGVDLIAPEGYGEVIGGSQRIANHDLLLQRLKEHELPVEPFQWYLDVRKYGTFPHSGFGMGIERFVAWMTGVKHLRETIPYPRMLHKIYP